MAVDKQVYIRADCLTHGLHAGDAIGRVFGFVDAAGKAVEGRDFLNAGLDGVFERYDAIITPAATGEAPAGLDSTGSPLFNSLWTYCGVPAISLPLMRGSSGLPIGVQLIGRRGDDARLLRTANWLIERLTGDEGIPTE